MVQRKLSFKIVFFGEEGVGRKTLFKSFSMYQDDRYIDTIGADLSWKTLNSEGYDVRLFIWNVNYKKEFRFTLLSFLRSSHAALLMFDITRLASFKYLSNLPHVIRKYVGAIPIFLIGNKKDLEGDREVSLEEGEIFARENDLLCFVEISAKQEKDCEWIFETLMKKILI